MLSTCRRPRGLNVPNNKPTNDPVIRAALRPHIAPAFSKDAVFIDELTLVSVEGRADLVVVDNHMHCYEIKSDVDSLTRLTREVKAYGQVMDFLTAVVVKKHLKGAQKKLPEYWGIKVYEKGSFHTERVPQYNGFHLDHLSLAKLLWKDTAHTLLHAHGVTDKRINKLPKYELHKMIPSAVTIDKVHAAVVEQFKNHRRRNR